MIDIKRMSLAVSAASKEQECYVKYCRDIGMDPSWVNGIFKNKLTGAEFKLIGLKKQGPLFTVWVEPLTSKLGNIHATSYSIKQFMTNCTLVTERENQ